MPRTVNATNRRNFAKSLLENGECLFVLCARRVHLAARARVRLPTSETRNGKFAKLFILVYSLAADCLHFDFIFLFAIPL